MRYPWSPFLNYAGRDTRHALQAEPGSLLREAMAMIHDSSLDQLVDRVCRHWEAQWRAEAARKEDPADPRNYDLLLNTSRFTIGECAELIIEALRRLQARALSPS